MSVCVWCRQPRLHPREPAPEGFTPKVSGLAFLGDGDLAVLTTGSVNSGGWDTSVPGKVFVLKGAQEADGPEDVTVVEAAGGLQNPMGIDVIDDKIYVSERYQLTELSDADGDGSYETRRKVAEYPSGNNFHEFAFGLIHDEENFYVNLSVAIDNGGATTNPQPAKKNRGTSVKIDRATGAISYVAGGLRTPNGVAFGPEDELFAMDNQGAWAAREQAGQHQAGPLLQPLHQPGGPFDANPVTPPVVWIPQNEIGNSPSTPIMLGRPLRRPDDVRRRHVRRSPARLPREGRRGVPGCGLPPLRRFRGRREPRHRGS